jgi:NADH-quinone oxidoreductase subunit G
VNYEGRAQRYYKTLLNDDQVKESWQWIVELIKIKNRNQTGSWTRFDDIVSSLADEIPVFSRVKEYMPDADFRMLNMKIPRQAIRFSGRTAINADKDVSEQRISQDNDSPLAFSMEGQPERPPSSLVPFYWTPGWNSVQALYNYIDESNGHMKGGDPGIRLIESGEGDNSSYFKINSKTIKVQKDEWLITPVYQIFGSEELSQASPSVVQRIREPFVYMNQKDADIFDVKHNELIQLEIDENKLNIRVKIENSLRQGIAGLSVNLPGMQYVELPGRGKFNKI